MIVTSTKMLPQKVTSRYASNLLKTGINREFKLHTIQRETVLHDELKVGEYFTCSLWSIATRTAHTASGLSPLHAVTRALQEGGVTFQ